MDCFGLLVGAEGESRTPTGEPPLDPEPSVSTNSTTSAFRLKQRSIYLQLYLLASKILKNLSAVGQDALLTQPVPL